ncbi:unnamed protein product [Allacma fusca]|uniref:CCHC-type domain-containing protein n=1 Tax=Allacma fusca TaxID=39272 RepID=A0A8J2PEA2_9HEXA|nr:unnamed protein product [Allacma fusca]
MLAKVLPLSLDGPAYRWLRFLGPFATLDAFKVALRREFQAVGYSVELRKELDERYQGPDEPLTSFIQAINCYYMRLEPNASDDVKVAKIISLMHPEYRFYVMNRTFRTMRELASAAHVIQEQIKHTRDYKLPRESEQSLEPSCAWVPARSLKSSGIESHLTTPGQPTEADLKLKFPAIDPFRYFHNSGTSRASRDRSRERPRENSGNTAGNRFRSSSRESTHRSPSPGPRGRPQPSRSPSPKRPVDMSTITCYKCKETGHYKSNCPSLKGNGQ